MEHPPDEHHQLRFTSDDLSKLKLVVKSNASAEREYDDLEDITGEILLSACVSAANANTTAPIAALAFRYAEYPSYYADARARAAKVASEDPSAYDWPSPETSTTSLSVEIRLVLSSLSPISRTIIWLHDVEGMTLAETATALGMSTATAHRRLQQAHADFRAAWDA